MPTATTPTNTTTPANATAWQPKWYDEQHVTAWARIKEALRRDWEQTRADLGLPGGHNLNQGAEDTIKQAARTEPIPPDDRPNPPRIIGRWDEAEYPLGYGFTAHRAFGAEHPTWNEGIEQRLRSEWQSRERRAEDDWAEVRDLIKYGYDYTPRH